MQLLKTNQDIKQGTSLRASMFDSINAVAKADRLAECPKCKVLYCSGGRIHTVDGWK